MKCGSTWIWYNLATHPQVQMPNQKEMHYFDQLTITPEQYLEHFSHIDKQFLTGEITPAYMTVVHAPILAKSICPQAKIIVILRNPVDRAFSHWKVAVWTESKIPSNISFMQAFNFGYPFGPIWHTIRERGLYHKYLKRWYKEFPEDQIKILWYDDVQNKPLELLKDLYTWLGIDNTFISKNYKKKFNENWSERNPVFKPEDRKKILDYYLPSIEKLEKFTGRDLLDWKKL